MQTNTANPNSLPPDIFRLSFTRIIASILCKMGLHQSYIFYDTDHKLIYWVCPFCGHKANEISNVSIRVMQYDQGQTILTQKGN